MDMWLLKQILLCLCVGSLALLRLTKYTLALLTRDNNKLSQCPCDPGGTLKMYWWGDPRHIIRRVLVTVTNQKGGGGVLCARNNREGRGSKERGQLENKGGGVLRTSLVKGEGLSN